MTWVTVTVKFANNARLIKNVANVQDEGEH